MDFDSDEKYLYCVQCNDWTWQNYRGDAIDGQKAYVCSECACLNIDPDEWLR
jgi:hypothetical protein